MLHRRPGRLGTGPPGGDNDNKKNTNNDNNNNNYYYESNNNSFSRGAYYCYVDYDYYDYHYCYYYYYDYSSLPSKGAAPLPCLERSAAGPSPQKPEARGLNPCILKARNIYLHTMYIQPPYIYIYIYIYVHTQKMLICFHLAFSHSAQSRGFCRCAVCQLLPHMYDNTYTNIVT